MGNYSHILSQYDGKARVAQLKENMAKLQIAKLSYDITDLLEKSLYGK